MGSFLPVVILFPCPPPGGFAALLSDGERNAEEDSAYRRIFQETFSFSHCSHIGRSDEKIYMAWNAI